MSVCEGIIISTCVALQIRVI